MNVAYPGKDALQDEDASYEATCLVCGNVDHYFERLVRPPLTNCAAGEPWFDPWIDDHEMPAGTTLHRGIADGMDASCAVVFFVTENFEDERWLAREVDHAVHRKIDRDDKFRDHHAGARWCRPACTQGLRLGERHASSRRDARDRQSAADRTRSTPLARQDLAEVTCKLRPGDPRARHDRPLRRTSSRRRAPDLLGKGPDRGEGPPPEAAQRRRDQREIVGKVECEPP